MKKTNYVPTTLGSYLNESNRSIMLTRKYGESQPVVVGSRAPLRNQVLYFVDENVKVSRPALKKFIEGLNETTSNPAATNMWLKRNEKFFIVENKAGIVSYRLSKLGERLLNAIAPMTESKKIMPFDKSKKKLDPKKDLLLDENEEEDELKESREERIERIIEGIKAKRAAFKLFEAEDEEAEDEEVEDEEAEDEEAEDETEETEDEEFEEVETEEVETEEVESEDDDRVEITEFIISVDDVQAAIAELAELGIDASEVGFPAEDEEGNLDAGANFDEPEMDMEGGEDEMEDFDLDLGGEIGGEEAPAEDDMQLEEMNEDEDETSLDDIDAELDSEEGEEDDELSMDDLDATPAEGEEEPMTDEIPMDDESGVEDEMGEVGGSGSQIKVSAENWDKLKGWLESKGVDIEEMFGGEIEVEGDEEGVEDEINFDDLEEMPVDEDGEDESEEHEEGETEEEEEEQEEGDDDSEEDEE